MSLWFTASAVAPQLQLAVGAGRAADGVAHRRGAARLRGGHRRGRGAEPGGRGALAPLLRRVGAAGAASPTRCWWLAPGYAAALALRFLTGFFLAGVYPPAMKMIATWFRSARGLAIGTVVGALTLGKATPYLTRALEGADDGLGGARRLGGRRGGGRCWWASATGRGPSPSPGAPSPGGWWAPSCATGPPGWPRPATSATCGSCTPCGLRSAMFFLDFYRGRGQPWRPRHLVRPGRLRGDRGGRARVRGGGRLGRPVGAGAGGHRGDGGERGCALVIGWLVERALRRSS